MTRLITYLTKALALLLPAFLLVSCNSYNRQLGNYYSYVVSNNYHKAYTSVDHVKKLQVSRNRLLYLLEKGRMAHLIGQYDSSNRFLNEADLLMEDARTSAKDITLGTLANPMMQTYKGEDFEKFMVHYYKTLNYLFAEATEEAMVEARRISLQSYDQQEKKRGYTDDAFSLVLQGVIYEKAGDRNNAFISYRNAADLYLKNHGTWYGTPMPDQLKKDVLRTAVLNNFMDEADRYRQLFGIAGVRQEAPAGGELVLFWENGLAPVKKEENFIFSLTKDGGGNFMFTDPAGAVNIPFHAGSTVDTRNIRLEDFRSLRVAFPAYQEQPLYYTSAVAMVNNATYPLEAAENINALAFATLRERFLKETALALSRMAVKKLLEEAAQPKKDDKNKNEKEIAAFALQVLNFATERADTRNWQSLPHTIHYTRIPLQEGPNLISLQLSQTGGGTKTIRLQAEGSGRLQVRNICTLTGPADNL